VADDGAEGILIRLHDDLEKVADSLVDAVKAMGDDEAAARSSILHAAGQLQGMCMALGWQGYVPDQ
jgi:hypothetical protein